MLCDNPNLLSNVGTQYGANTQKRIEIYQIITLCKLLSHLQTIFDYLIKTI